MSASFTFLPELFLRTPFYSFQDFEVDNLSEVLNDENFRKAIYLASPSFYEILEKQQFQLALLNDKARISLLKYFNRMCFRPTPFGLFATFSQTRWIPQNHSDISIQSKVKTHILFDQQINLSVADYLTKDKQEVEVLYVNPTVYETYKQLRYIKTVRKINTKFDYSLDTIETNSVLKQLVKSCTFPGIGYSLIIQQIIKLTSCTKIEAIDYVSFLKEEGILFNNWMPNIIGDLFLNQLMNNDNIKQSLVKTSSTIFDQISKSSIHSLKKRVNALSKTFTNEQLNAIKTPFYANTQRFVNGGLSIKYQSAIATCINALHKIDFENNHSDLIQFKEKFKKRFDQQRIPFLVALDLDMGVGYGNKEQLQSSLMIENLPFDVNKNQTQNLPWNRLQQIIMDKWTAKETFKTKIIHLNTADIENIPDRNESKMAPSIAVMFRILNDGVYLENAGGNSAISLLGRFTIFSDDILKTCRTIANKEKQNNPDMIFADVGQLSSYHTDNINLRQSIYDFEIPINVKSTKDAKYQIPLNSLTVSIRNDQIILESTILKKRIIPRHCSAFNGEHNDLPIFKFLFDLQNQGIQTNYNLNLEYLFPNLKSYPRLMFENNILCLAKWKLYEADLKEILNMDISKAKSALIKLKESLQLPEVIAIIHHDHQLVFNLSKNEELTLLINCLRGLTNVTIQEYPFIDFNCNTLFNAENKPMVGQYITYLINNERVYHAASFKQQIIKNATRTFHPGGEWLYLKLYCEESTSNTLITDFLFPVIKKLSDKNELVWFFIRYHDPEPHLRLRLKFNQQNQENTLELFYTKLKALFKYNVVKDYQINTYERELERYGEFGIALMENVFYHSSQLILDFLHGNKLNDSLYIEHEFGLYAVNKILHLFIPSPSEKLIFLNQRSDTFLKEFSKDKNLKVELDKKYRQMRVEVSVLLSNLYYFKQRKLQKSFLLLENKIEHLINENDFRNKEMKWSLCSDIIHMHLNRLFNQQQRQQELIIYYLLAKHHKGVNSISNNKID